MGNSEIGRKLHGSLESPLLKMRITKACSQAVEKTPVTIEVLIMQVIYETIIQRANFIVMPSLPTELVSFRSFIMRTTVSVSTGWVPKVLPSPSIPEVSFSQTGYCTVSP